MKPYTSADKDRLQSHLAVIRKVAGWTTADLGNLIGVTKQTISNIETGKATLTKTQYIAIRAILDYEISSNPNNTTLAQVVNILLDSEDATETDRMKVEATKNYIVNAKASGLNNAALSAGIAAMATAFGVPLPVTPIWLGAILLTKKQVEKSLNNHE